MLPTLATTAVTTAILEAGARSLAEQGRRVELVHQEDGSIELH